MDKNIYYVKNNDIEIEISKHPFQISSIKYKEEELIYQKDQNWKWSFPIMAPICTLAFGKRSNEKNEYLFNNKKYDLIFHGFSRHNKWDLVKIEENKVVVSQNHESNESYPWSFKILYTIEIIEENVNVSFLIQNLSDEGMYYSTGMHPGYLLKGNDQVKINNLEKYDFSMSDSYLVEKNPEIIISKNKVNISKDLNFKKYDTLVGEKTKDVSFSLLNDFGELNFKTNFTRLWLWQENNEANYICLETTDTTPPDINEVRDIKDRKEISFLPQGKNAKRFYNMKIIPNNKNLNAKSRLK